MPPDWQNTLDLKNGVFQRDTLREVWLHRGPDPENRIKLPLPDKQYDDKDENGNSGERIKDFTNR
jgi:hypothetical protein